MNTSKVANISEQKQGIHIVAKPIGSRCNLNYEYCFYLEKQALFPQGKDYVMPDDVLQAYITKYITPQPNPQIGFVWQGETHPAGPRSDNPRRFDNGPSGAGLLLPYGIHPKGYKRRKAIGI